MVPGRNIVCGVLIPATRSMSAASFLAPFVQVNRRHLVIALTEPRNISNDEPTPFKDSSKSFVGSRTVRRADGPFDLPIPPATSIPFDERDKSRQYSLPSTVDMRKVDDERVARTPAFSQHLCAAYPYHNRAVSKYKGVEFAVRQRKKFRRRVPFDLDHRLPRTDPT